MVGSFHLSAERRDDEEALDARYHLVSFPVGQKRHVDVAGAVRKDCQGCSEMRQVSQEHLVGLLQVLFVGQIVSGVGRAVA